MYPSRYAFSWDQWNNPWSVENRNGAWPRLQPQVVGYNEQPQATFWLDNLSYLRFKNIQLGYTLPKTWLHKLGIDNIRIYGSAENIATLTKFRGVDPEKASEYSNVYPLNKSYSFGLIIGI
jgi:hypothetical protein